MKTKNYTKNTAVISTLIIIAVALGNAGSTLYLPALVTISHNLNTNGALMKLTLSCYLISFGLSQLFYGPLSDAFGRRINLLTGVSIFFIGSLISMFSPNIWCLLAGRLIEGLGIGAANAVGYALMRDIYSGEKLTKQLSYVSVFVGMTPIIAPLFGGYLTQYMGWRSCFALLAIIAVILVVAKFYLLPETNKSFTPNAHKPKVAIKNYGYLLSKAIFSRYVIVTAFGFTSLIVLNAMLPFVIQNKLDISPSVYGWLTMITGGGYLCGSFLGGSLSAKCGIKKIIYIGIAINFIALIIGYIGSFSFMNVPVIITPLALFLFGIGFIIPIGSSGAMSPFPEKSGSAAALLGGFMFCFASIFTAISSHINEPSQKPIFISLFVLSLITLIFFFIIKSRKQRSK
ncbi:multidrug effflux MFS transporter [Francisellaceae bacterium]|nr:multidrug effflux MFS transporter [Francisellaceae bacterium]